MCSIEVVCLVFFMLRKRGKESSILEFHSNWSCKWLFDDFFGFLLLKHREIKKRMKLVFDLKHGEILLGKVEAVYRMGWWLWGIVVIQFTIS